MCQGLISVVIATLRGRPEPHALSLLNFLCMLTMAVSRSSSSRVTKFKGKRAFLGVFFPSDNALYSIAFGTHSKTAEPIEMPFGIITRVGPIGTMC